MALMERPGGSTPVTIKKNSTSVMSVDEVSKDLEEYKVVLEKARSIHAQWHLALAI